MTITGRPAQFGRGVIAEVGGRIIGKFATNLAAQLSGEGPPAAAAASTPAASTPAAGTPAATAPAEATQVMSTPAAAAGAGANGADGTAADPAQLPIEELDLPVRSFNSLRREGVHTVGGLAARTEKELLAIDGLGPQSIKEIKGRLADHGLTLTTPGVTTDAASGTAAAAGSAAPGTSTTSEGATTSTAAAASTGASTATGTTGPRPAAATPGTGGWDADAPATDRAAANGLLPPRGARPQDEEALDLLSVAGLPLLKRLAPLLGFLLIAGVAGAHRPPAPPRVPGLSRLAPRPVPPMRP